MGKKRKRKREKMGGGKKSVKEEKDTLTDLHGVVAEDAGVAGVA